MDPILASTPRVELTLEELQAAALHLINPVSECQSCNWQGAKVKGPTGYQCYKCGHLILRTDEVPAGTDEQFIRMNEILSGKTQLNSFCPSCKEQTRRAEDEHEVRCAKCGIMLVYKHTLT